MIPLNKIKKVRNYLNKDLSIKTFECEYDAGRQAEIFILKMNDNTITISVLDEFFDGKETGEIKKKLKDFCLLEFVRHGLSKQITVTKFGLKLEDY